ncbi:putative inactive shikimate kinase like 1, chloroplastic [Apium graveolens]|uniref:putative inactive shikimate kinase like 1, chloroplastic n=1 Tax=Apium graveolens TaxID=4045 RepID=UPI003D7B90F3
MNPAVAACLESSISCCFSFHSSRFFQFPTFTLIPNTPPPPPRLSFKKSTSALTCSIRHHAVSGSTFELQNKADDIASHLRGTCIYLVGINTKIKTSLGKFIAQTLRYYFFDSDKLIEEATGGSAAAKSFRERDEKGFRESETEVLKQLSSMGRLVVSAGNGAFGSPANLSLLRHGILIWIDIPLDMIAKEAVEDGLELSELELSPTVSYPEVLDQLTALYKQMQDGYATADATISLQKLAQKLGYDALDAVTEEDMGLEVLKELEKLMRVKKLMEEAARPF